MNKRRKGIMDDPLKVQQLRELIVEYDENHNIYSKVRYKEICDFVQLTYNKGKLEFKAPKETWWKTTGKTIVDEYNMVKMKSIRISKKKQIDVPEIMDLIEKYGGKNKEQLKKYMEPIDIYFSRLSDRVFELENKVEILRMKAKEQEQDILSLMNTNNKLQNLIFALFTYGKKNDNELFDLIKIGKSRSEVVNLSLDKTFEDPVAFISELTKYVEVRNDSIQKEDNLISFPTNKSSKDTDYDW